MKLRVLMVALVALAILACNREGPLNVAGVDENATVDWTVEQASHPDSVIYKIYLPASWSPSSGLDSLRPWVQIFQNGYSWLHKIYNDEIQNPDPGRMNYYKQTFYLSRYDVVTVLLDYGKYRNGNDPDHIRSASLKGRDNPYIVVYQANKNRNDDKTYLGFTLTNGYVAPLNQNLLVPIRAEIGVDLPIRVGIDGRFTVNNLSYTGLIGIKSLVWEFSDGYKRYGNEVFERFDRAGRSSVILTITDNANKSLVLSKTFDVFN